MLILDTDHFSELVRETMFGLRLRQRLEATKSEIAITIITLDEQARGWLSLIKQSKRREQIIDTYAKLQELFEIAARWQVLPWNDVAASVSEATLRRKLRLGTMDLRIAAITIANGGRLLSRNLKDFRRIDGLDVEDWLS